MAAAASLFKVSGIICGAALFTVTMPSLFNVWDTSAAASGKS